MRALLLRKEQSTACWTPGSTGEHSEREQPVKSSLLAKEWVADQESPLLTKEGVGEGLSRSAPYPVAGSFTSRQ
jgi:hypothetical protein